MAFFMMPVVLYMYVDFPLVLNFFSDYCCQMIMHLF